MTFEDAQRYFSSSFGTDFSGFGGYTNQVPLGWRDPARPHLKDFQICGAIAKAEDDACRSFGEWMRDKSTRISMCRSNPALTNRIVNYCKDRYAYHISNP